MHGTMPDVRRRGKPRTAWMDNSYTWIAIRGRVNQNEDRDKRRKYSMVWPTLGSRMATEQKRTKQSFQFRQPYTVDGC